MSNDSKIGMKQCSITQMYILNNVMNRCLIKIVAISTKKFVLRSILFGRNHSPNSLNIMYSTHTLSLIFHKGYYCFQVISLKIIEMQKHKDNDNINVKCRYCNQAPKFQLVKVNTNVGITGPKILSNKSTYECEYYN
jgi:hypothetical protein